MINSFLEIVRLSEGEKESRVKVISDLVMEKRRPSFVYNHVCERERRHFSLSISFHFNLIFSSPSSLLLIFSFRHLSKVV